MSAKSKARQQVLALVAEIERQGGKVDRLQVSQRLFKALGSGEPPLDVDGTPVFPMSDREEMLQKAQLFAYYRWNLDMSPTDVETLYKAVPTEELMALIPIIMDQHIDGHNYKDPTDELDEDEMESLRETLKEIGFGDVEI